MQPADQRPRRHWLSSSVLPVFVLIGGLLLSVVAWRVLQLDAEKRQRQRFELLEERLITSVQQRFTELSILMVHARTLASLQEPDAAQWGRFHEGVSVHSPRGLVGIGYVMKVSRDSLPELERRLAAMHGRNFYIESGGDGPFAYIVSLIEPQRENFAALGKDLTTGSTRRAAAEAAMYTGELVTSRRINIVWREKTLPGFLAFLPVYRAEAAPRDPDQRAAALRGWVYASIQAEQLFDGLQAICEGQLDYEFFEGDTQDHASLLYDSDQHLKLRENEAAGPDKYRTRSFVSHNELNLLGRSWHLAVSTRPEFDRATFDPVPVFVLSAGILLSALGAILVWSLLGSRDRARAEAFAMTQDLRRSEARNHRLALIASRTRQGVVLGDMNGVSWVNEGFTRMTGYGLQDISGRRLSDVLAGKGTDLSTVQRLKQALLERREFTGEVLVYRKDATPQWLLFEMQPLDDEGRPGGTSHMTLFTDISERVRGEQLLRQAKEEADAANRAKGAFLAVMSHEIRTPLNGVIGMTSVLAETELNSEQREFVSIIQSSGNTLLHLINDILDFSKIESGRLELESIPFSPRAIVGEVVDLLMQRLSDKHLDLVVDVEEDVPLVVRGDPTRLKQILMNLTGNAVKFTEHGEIEVRVGCAPPEGEHIVLSFSVRDSGVGISPEAQTRLFQSFSQADASTTRRYGGTGLGLAISKRLAEQMGGQMGVESVVGEGATFFFTIRATCVAAVPGAGDRGPPPLRDKRVLVVDDNPTCRRALSCEATRWGSHVRAASGAVEALQWLEAGEHFDIALVDQHMPDMDGPTLAAELTRHPRTASLPVVLLARDPRALEEGQRRLFALICPKPGHPGQLSQLLAGYFDGSQPGGGGEPAAEAFVKAARSERVLLVEDDPVNQRVAVLMLRRLGFHAELAQDGAAALALYTQKAFDIVMVDLQMPGVSGLDVAVALRRSETHLSGHKPWLIALTANVMPEDRRRCRQAGMDDFLGKPVSDDELLAAMERASDTLRLRRG